MRSRLHLAGGRHVCVRLLAQLGDYAARVRELILEQLADDPLDSRGLHLDQVPAVAYRVVVQRCGQRPEQRSRERLIIADDDAFPPAVASELAEPDDGLVEHPATAFPGAVLALLAQWRRLLVARRFGLLDDAREQQELTMPPFEQLGLGAREQDDARGAAAREALQQRVNEGTIVEH